MLADTNTAVPAAIQCESPHHKDHFGIIRYEVSLLHIVSTFLMLAYSIIIANKFVLGHNDSRTFVINNIPSTCPSGEAKAASQVSRRVNPECFK